jgi:hypothetical protein
MTLVRHDITSDDDNGKEYIAVVIDTSEVRSKTKLILYQTYFILNLFYTKLILYQTYFTPNLFYTELILYRTYFIPVFLHTKFF